MKAERLESKMKLFRTIGLIICAVLTDVRCEMEPVEEQSCSRFEFEHKLLESLVRLEHSHKLANEEIKKLKMQITDQPPQPNQEVKGGNYVRWGKTSCPSGATVVYKGYAGGSLYSDTGAASNYLCLPEQPQWSAKSKTYHLESNSDAGGRVYGAEYQLENGYRDFFGEAIDHKSTDVPCVVCETPRPNILMIPGRTTCYDGWSHEYTGFLASGYFNHTAASEYVCLDESPEAVPDSDANKNGVLFYLVEAMCGSLKCPPYINRRILSCIVCSK